MIILARDASGSAVNRALVREGIVRHCVNSIDCYEGNVVEIVAIGVAVLIVGLLIKRIF